MQASLLKILTNLDADVFVGNYREEMIEYLQIPRSMSELSVLATFANCGIVFMGRSEDEADFVAHDSLKSCRQEPVDTQISAFERELELLSIPENDS